MERPHYVPFNVYEHVLKGRENIQRLRNFMVFDDKMCVLDIDGIGLDLPTPVINDFNQKTGLSLHPKNIDHIDYLKNIADQTENLPEDILRNPQGGWYNHQVVRQAQQYIYSKSFTNKILKEFGSDNVFVITARSKEITEWTKDVYARLYPGIKRENIISNSNKAPEINKHAEGRPCLFVDDYLKTIIDVLNRVRWSLCLHVPLGIMPSDYDHGRLITVARYPVESQGMVPAYNLIKECSPNVAQY